MVNTIICPRDGLDTTVIVRKKNEEREGIKIENISKEFNKKLSLQAVGMKRSSIREVKMTGTRHVST